MVPSQPTTLFESKFERARGDTSGGALYMGNIRRACYRLLSLKQDGNCIDRHFNNVGGLSTELHLLSVGW